MDHIDFKSDICKGKLSIVEKKKWLEGEAFRQQEVEHIDFISDISKSFLSTADKKKWLEAEAFKKKEIEHIDFKHYFDGVSISNRVKWMQDHFGRSFSRHNSLEVGCITAERLQMWASNPVYYEDEIRRFSNAHANFVTSRNSDAEHNRQVNDQSNDKKKIEKQQTDTPQTGVSNADKIMLMQKRYKHQSEYSQHRFQKYLFSCVKESSSVTQQQKEVQSNADTLSKASGSIEARGNQKKHDEAAVNVQGKVKEGNNPTNMKSIISDASSRGELAYSSRADRFCGIEGRGKDHKEIQHQVNLVSEITTLGIAAFEKVKRSQNQAELQVENSLPVNVADGKEKGDSADEKEDISKIHPPVKAWESDLEQEHKTLQEEDSSDKIQALLGFNTKKNLSGIGSKRKDDPKEEEKSDEIFNNCSEGLTKEKNDSVLKVKIALQLHFEEPLKKGGSIKVKSKKQKSTKKQIYYRATLLEEQRTKPRILPFRSFLLLLQNLFNPDNVRCFHCCCPDRRRWNNQNYLLIDYQSSQSIDH